MRVWRHFLTALEKGKGSLKNRERRMNCKQPRRLAWSAAVFDPRVEPRRTLPYAKALSKKCRLTLLPL